MKEVGTSPTQVGVDRGLQVKSQHTHPDPTDEWRLSKIMTICYWQTCYLLKKNTGVFPIMPKLAYLLLGWAVYCHDFIEMKSLLGVGDIIQ